MDDLLLTERMLRDSALTGMDDFLKTDLTMAIDRIPDDDHRDGLDAELKFQNSRDFGEFERLLYPIASRDDLCVGAHNLLCRTMLAIEQRKFMVGAAVATLRERDRRFIMALTGVNVYNHGNYEVFTQHLRASTTADRVIVLGFTCMFARDCITGEWEQFARLCPMCGEDIDHGQ